MGTELKVIAIKLEQKMIDDELQKNIYDSYEDNSDSSFEECLENNDGKQNIKPVMDEVNYILFRKHLKGFLRTKQNLNVLSLKQLMISSISDI